MPPIPAARQFRTARPPVVSDRLVATVFQVKCNPPHDQDGDVLGRNVFWLTGPSAEIDAKIIAAELRVRGWSGVRIDRQEHRKIRRRGEPTCRNVYLWTEVEG